MKGHIIALLSALAFGGTAAYADETTGTLGELGSKGRQNATAVHPCQPGLRSPDQATLSDKLADCNGVLRPAVGMDPEIKVQAPDPHPGTTPVIRPNLQHVQPK